MFSQRMMSVTLINVQRSVSSVLLWLVKPHKSIVDAEQRQHAQLLSSILLTILAVGIILLSIVIYVDPQDLYDVRVEASGVALLAVLGLYIANSLGCFRAATLGLIFSLTVIFVVPVYAENPDPTFLAFVLVPMLLAGMFLSFRWTAIIFAAILATVYVLNLTVTSEERWELRTSWYFLSFAGALVLTFMHHLQRLEVDPARQAGGG